MEYKSMRHIAACDKLPQVEVLYCDEALAWSSGKSPDFKRGRGYQWQRAEDASTLIATADQALYRAKRRVGIGLIQLTNVRRWTLLLPHILMVLRLTDWKRITKHGQKRTHGCNGLQTLASVRSLMSTMPLRNSGVTIAGIEGSLSSVKNFINGEVLRNLS
jgi:hypothetical protein